jgi:anti-sigma regulatory factor (Ser/Thr protein kinase)
MQVEDDPDPLALCLEPRRESAGYARDTIRSTFGRRLPERVLGDLLLVVTELITNAVQHGPGRPISLAVTVDSDGDVVRGEVVDEGQASKSIPRIREATVGGGGFGLRLVDAMTSEWYVVEGSTSVRFEMPASAD